MADGSVMIDVGLDVGKAERDLAKLKEKIAKLETELNKNSEQKSTILADMERVCAQLDEATDKVNTLKEAYKNATGDKKSLLKEELGEAVEEQRILTREANRLNSEYDRVNKKIQTGTANLNSMQAEAGQLAGEIERARPGEALAQSLENAKAKLASFVKTALGIASVAVLFRKLKSAIVDSVKAFAEEDAATRNTINELKASLAALQASWGAAFAPILTAVAPLLQTLIGWLTTAANAVARFIAIISGRSTYKKAVANVGELASGVSGAGAAASDAADAVDDIGDAIDDASEEAEKAKRQLAGFDELEILADLASANSDTGSNKKNNKGKSGSGGGGGSGAAGKNGFDLVEEAVDAFDGSFLSNLALTVKNVLFDWDELNPEQIAQKIIAGLGAVLGAALGIALGMGPGGVLLMTLAGLTLGLILDTLIFNNDGVLSQDELKKSLGAALAALTGGAIGFALGGGVKGAIRGAALGATAYLALEYIDFKAGGKARDLINNLVGVLGAVAGGVIGFKVGGLGGAAIGATIGAAIQMTVQDILFGDQSKTTTDKILGDLVNILPVAGAIIGWKAGRGTGALLGATIGAAVTLAIKAINPENGSFNAQSVVSGILNIIAGIGGAIAGFALTGTVQGALIGFSVMTSITMLLSFTEANTTGGAQMLASIVKGALVSLAGALVGFVVMAGNPIGAFIGFAITFALTLVLDKLSLDEREKQEAIARFKETELGQELEEIQKEIQESMEGNLDLRLRINSIMGEVDEATLVNLGTAQQLIDEIFNLDAKENKTSAEAQLLKEKIEALNSLGLPGIQASFDETTGHVQSTRAEVQGLLNDLLVQYQIEAMRDAYVEAYKAQYNATVEVRDITGEAQRAAEAYETAQNNLRTATENYNTALQNYKKYQDEIASSGSGGAISEQAANAASEFEKAKKAMEEAEVAADAAKGAVANAETALSEAMVTYDTATEKIDGIAQKLAELSGSAKEEGINTMEGNAEGITEAAPKSVEAITKAAEDTLDALRTTLDTHSPSKKTMEIGKEVMEGLQEGIESGTQAVESTITELTNTMLSQLEEFVSQSRTAFDQLRVDITSAVSEISESFAYMFSPAIDAVSSQMIQCVNIVHDAVQQMVDLWNTDWGTPHFHMPIFSMSGVFDLQTGQAPQVVISGWTWLARGGIVDGATLIGAGEDGKEAIVPLERNTEWINLVADGLANKLLSNSFVNDLASAFASAPMPAMAGGGVVPPNAVTSAYGGGWSNSIMEELKALRSEISALASQPIQVSSKLMMDRREVGKAVTEYQRQTERAYGGN